MFFNGACSQPVQIGCTTNIQKGLHIPKDLQMTITKQDAESALQQVELTSDRAREFRSYGRAAPHFFVWGAVWVSGYVGNALFSQQAGPVWWVAATLGILGSYIVWRVHSKAEGRQNWRFPAFVLLFFVFVQATFYVLKPESVRAIATFPALTIAAAYIATGLLGRLRIAATGLVIGCATIGGFALLGSDFAFYLWMGIVGGGALIAMGLWLKYL